ncbi:serine hydrolase [Oceanicaulis sp.]|uniref:serine hydrolase n=1 Tax=Oceanicaulis sp. TaxID=1924941 RepID=UPI003F6E689C
MARILLFLVCALSVIALAPRAEASERYAAFVADMQTGEVLHARRADALRYPASLTKMMTLYMLFDALERGEIVLDDSITASSEAASRPASRLGLRAGQTLTVETAIRALIIQSANDVAVAVAEHLEGDEARFAEVMTARARELGMANTVFRNASGLPDARQQTTARDIARLAYALHRDFPDYYAYFSETRFRWNGVTHRTHNTLVGDQPGVDGLKTGYIRASGFNLAASAERDGHRIIAVVMGGASASVRDAHARELIEAAYSAINARSESRMLAALNMPRLNPVREQEILTAELSTLPAQTAQGSAPGVPAARVELEPLDGLRTYSAPETPSDWAVQVGAYTSQAAASARLESVAMMGLHTLLGDAQARVEPMQRNGRQLWRARYAGLDGSRAQSICQRLEASGESCFAVPPAA